MGRLGFLQNRGGTSQKLMGRPEGSTPGGKEESRAGRGLGVGG